MDLRGHYRLYGLIGLTFFVSFVLFELASYHSFSEDHHNQLSGPTVIPPSLPGGPIRGLSPERTAPPPRDGNCYYFYFYLLFTRKKMWGK